MPTFCRHNRFLENCPICRTAQPAGPTRSRASGTRAPRARSARPPASASGGLRVRRLERAQADDYAHELVPGLHATADARRLAEEIAFSIARLELLAADPPGLYREIAASEDREEGTWLAFLIAYLGPLEEGEPFAGIRAARVPWASGELPPLDGVPLGPRTAHDPVRGHRTVVSYRAWAGRAGSQRQALLGDPSWSPQRRFDRAFERLALPGLGRASRFEFLLLCGRLGLVDMEPSSLQLGRESDATVLAAKRVFGIGDAINLHRRAADLATAAQVPIGALDLALVNWARPPRPPGQPGPPGPAGASGPHGPGERITAGTPEAAPDPEVRTRLAAVLGVEAE